MCESQIKKILLRHNSIITYLKYDLYRQNCYFLFQLQRQQADHWFSWQRLNGLNRNLIKRVQLNPNENPNEHIKRLGCTKKVHLNEDFITDRTENPNEVPDINQTVDSDESSHEDKDEDQDDNSYDERTCRCHFIRSFKYTSHISKYKTRF